jgi:hypothetical protein
MEKGYRTGFLCKQGGPHFSPYHLEMKGKMVFDNPSAAAQGK